MVVDYNYIPQIESIKVKYNLTANTKMPICVIKKKSSFDTASAYINSCDVLIPSGEKIVLHNGEFLNTYYTLTNMEKGNLIKLSTNDINATRKLQNNIKVIKVDKDPLFDDFNFAKVNIFVFENDEENQTIKEKLENEERMEQNILNTGASIGVAIAKSDNKTKNKYSNKKNICICVRDPLSTKLYNYMKGKQVKDINLKFEDVSACLEYLTNVIIDHQISIEQLGTTISQLKILSSIFNTSIIYKIFISSFLHTKKFINADWKNKIIILYILYNIEYLLTDFTNISPCLIREIEKPENQLSINKIADILSINSEELIQTVYDSYNKIGNHNIVNQSSIGKKGDLIFIEFIDGNITDENKGVSEFYCVNNKNESLKDIISEIN